MKHGIESLSRVIALCLAITFGSSLMSHTAYATSPERAVVVMTCPGAADPNDALCRALSDALIAERPASALVRRVQPSEAPALRDGDLFVAVVIDAQSDTGITAHLEWRTGTSASGHSGPPVTLDVVDANLAPTMLSQLVRGLLQVDPALRQALQDIRQP